MQRKSFLHACNSFRSLYLKANRISFEHHVEIHNIHRIQVLLVKTMRWSLRRIVEELIVFVFGILWVFVISGALQNAYPMFPLLFLGVISPIGAVLLHIFLFLKVPPPKGRRKWFVVAALGMAGMPLGVFLGPVGIITLPAGLLIWMFGMRASWPRKVPKEALEVRSSETPKSFFKNCVACDRQIPIASEECPFCQAKQ
jgi:hypothetical protein